MQTFARLEGQSHMNDTQSMRLGDAAALTRCTDSRFKTMKLSVNMLVPLAQGTAAAYGILPGLVTRATHRYPDFASLNRRLSELYGASLGAGVRKIGGFQCLSVSVGGIAGRYAFGGEDMLSELSGLLFSALFEPLRDRDGLFLKEHFDQEQRQLLELKDSEYSDKIAYAHQRCEETLFEGTDAALDRFGSRENIAALDRASLSAAWDKLMGSAQFEIFALGSCDPQPELFRERFSSLGTAQPVGPLAYREPAAVRRVTEEQDLAQSKLSLGFRVDVEPSDQLLFRLMSAVFGGVPSSKLFRNVREKMGLCYYCSSAFSPSGRALYVESGVETENAEKAETAILEQLRLLQNGELTEEELDAAKLALCNSFRSVGDSLNATESWYLAQVFSGRTETPEEAARQVMSYTAEQVAEAARKVKLGAVYCLKGRDDG